MGDVTHYAGDQCPGGHYEETTVRYRSRPQEVDAIQWTEGTTIDGVKDWVHDRRYVRLDFDTSALWLWNGEGDGWTAVPFGWWIVRGGDPDRYWPVAPEYFSAVYEQVGDDDA